MFRNIAPHLAIASSLAIIPTGMLGLPVAAFSFSGDPETQAIIDEKTQIINDVEIIQLSEQFGSVTASSELIQQIKAQENQGNPGELVYDDPQSDDPEEPNQPETPSGDDGSDGIVGGINDELNNGDNGGAGNPPPDPTPEPIPTPALLPGVVGFTWATLRRRLQAQKSNQ